MKYLIIITVSLLLALASEAQNNFSEDSLRGIIAQQKGDAAEVSALVGLADTRNQRDSAIKYAMQGLKLAQRINFKEGEADCFLLLIGNSSNVSDAISQGLNALKIYTQIKNQVGIGTANLLLQAGYRDIGDYRNSLAHAYEAKNILSGANLVCKLTPFAGHRLKPLLFAEIGQTYLLMNQLDSAEVYTKMAIEVHEQFNGAEWNFPVYMLAAVQNMEGQFEQAMVNFRSALPMARQNGFFRDTLQIFSGISTLFIRTGSLDSAIHYADMVAHSTNPEIEIKSLLEAVSNLAEGYKLRGNKDSAIKYIELRHSINDSVLGKEKDRDIQRITFNERLKQQKIETAQATYKSKVQLYGMGIGLFALLLIALLLWRSNQHKQKAKTNIEQAYNELRATQSQLIQREKMASLGELTAGIAHEIQNPLNFVNNFSEVNKELLVEMKHEMKQGNLIEATSIADNVINNQEKINHHGKRADAIVKGMLQHSRTSSGQKELTDINALTGEYSRLAYHGFKAKDKSFNATLETDFDNSIGKINIIPQEIGRVVLNLINNAFYAAPLPSPDNIGINSGGFKDPKYKHGPIVSVSTKKVGDKILISVRDNGPGIPQKMLDKIFQPFFTTKPTGQGTGLGLSLSYDIVKAHGGELSVKTKEGEGSEFIIQLTI